MRIVLLGLLAACLAGCGAQVTNTVIQPVSMCTTSLRSDSVSVTIDGLGASRLCRQYSRNRSAVGEHWTQGPEPGARRGLPEICRLQSSSDETEVIVTDVRGDAEGPAVCAQWRSSGWSDLSRREG
jgi:hypothetical protein